MARISYGARSTELAAAEPAAPAVVCGARRLERAELEAGANRLARVYREFGVGVGDLVSLALPNGIEFFPHCLAAWKLGAVPNPIPAHLPQREREALLARAAPKLVVGVDADAAARLPSLPPGFLPDASIPDGALPDATAPHERALASGGSTGAPKLIVAASPASYDPEAPAGIFHARRASLVPGPLTHAVPFSAAWQAILGGACAVVLPRFDALECLAAIERERCDRAYFVPTMLLRIWRLPEAERRRFDLASLEYVLSGGAPLAPWLMRAWIDWLGPDVMNEAFGPSERIGGTVIGGREWLAHPGSVGRPSAGSRLRIVDPQSGRVLPPGELGEIYLLPAGGTGSTYHYVGSTPKRDAEGWESVGDMGWLDADGYLYLGDRQCDMILVGGRNVYPAEIEAALDEHPAVRASCAIGLPDEDLGSRIHALVELSEPVEEAALRAHLAERLARYKRPHTIERVQGPLRDEAGKLRRSALRAERLASPPVASR